MSKGRIRVRLKSYDHRIIDESCEKILEAALASGAKVVGPIPLPTKKKTITVLSSPHVDKNAREQFQVIVHKRIIDIVEPTDRTIDSLSHLDIPAGVGVEIRM